MIDIEAIAQDIVDCAIKVYKAPGPGLLESAYQNFVLNLPGETSYPKRPSFLE